MSKLSVKAALAATLGMDIRDLSEYRYQPSRYTRAIFTIGENYFCTGKTKPEEPDGVRWEQHPDTFWAERAGTKIWRGSFPVNMAARLY